MATEEPREATSSAPDWHRQDARQTVEICGVDPDRGLSAAEAAKRLARWGPNRLPGGTQRSLWRLVLEQFNDFMVLVLLAAAGVSGLIGERTDTVVILLIVTLNASIGVFQRWRADQALAALQGLAAPRARVRREGQWRSVPAEELVPGDIVALEAGDQVGADLRLIEVAQLQVDESALTGESVSVAKHTEALDGPQLMLGDRANMAFKGTLVTHGRAIGVVVATGSATELGKIARLLGEAGERLTPLQQRLADFGRRLTWVILGICIVIFVAGLLRGEPALLMALTAISLAVAAIPEALPAVVTVLLALGARKMVRHHVLARRLSAVESLGSVTFICSDKTGTLTRNRMHAERLLAPGRRWQTQDAQAPEGFEPLLRAAALCNDAHRAPQNPAASGSDGRWRGDPTEVALVELAALAGLDKSALDAQTPRLAELPFDATRKRMTSFHRVGERILAYTKGAPESVLPRCNQVLGANGRPEPIDVAAWLADAEALAAQGLRVLALAQKEHAAVPGAPEPERDESGLTLLGLVGLIDPPRPEAAHAVRECRQAGITPVMITGDHPATARAIAHRIGILDDAREAVLSGPELASMDDDALRARVRAVRVYARMDPAQKIRIVEALQREGEFVAMTGDGVNDAPALKRADIGVAMGQGGTDVAREAAGLVLLDDNFASIVAAVREGRRIYDNIRKFVRYAMTGNSAEIWVLMLAPMVGLPLPLLPIHILWVNLLTDGLPGLALAAEPGEPDLMRRPPRPPKESLFAHGMAAHILGFGLLIAGLCLAIQAWALHSAQAHWQTMVFTVLTFGQLAHILAIRSETQALWRLGLRSNRPLLGTVLGTIALQLAVIYVPALNPIFRTEPLDVADLGLCLGSALLVWLAVEGEKAWRRRRTRGAASL